MRWRCLRNQQPAHPPRSCQLRFRSFDSRKKLKLPRRDRLDRRAWGQNRPVASPRVSAPARTYHPESACRPKELPLAELHLPFERQRCPRSTPTKAAQTYRAAASEGSSAENCSTCATASRTNDQRCRTTRHASDAVPHLGRAQHKQHVLSSIRTGAGAAASRRCPPPQGRVKSPRRSCRRPRFQRG